MRPSILIMLIFFFITSCKNEKERAIVGRWSAAKLVECDDVVPMNNTAVNLEFMPNGNYIFNSTLNVHEEGEFYIKKNHLYTKDKLRDKAVEKIVKIQELAADTLVLEMNYKGKEQWLTLVRDKNAKPTTAPIAKTTEPQPNPTPTNNNAIAVSAPSGEAQQLATSAPATTTVAPKPEVKPEPKKDEDISAAEAYRRREALRQKEEAERVQSEKEKREAYLKREAQRQKEELERKRAALEREKEHDKEVREAYLKREAKRKEEERQRKAKKS